uniref:Peptidase aspartic putative domain-containing protein n=1 Tax=Anopheles quadriannulatus TaxID=34691 RepID=A0A182XQ18_ANOQN
MCYACKLINHEIRDCRKFVRYSTSEKWNVIRAAKLCIRCLRSHGRRPCNNPVVCFVDSCTRQHHPLLHQSSENQNVAPCNHSAHIEKKEECLFRIMPVTLYRGNNQIDTYAFVDEGSSLTMIEMSLAKELGVHGEKDPLQLVFVKEPNKNQ